MIYYWTGCLVVALYWFFMLYLPTIREMKKLRIPINPVIGNSVAMFFVFVPVHVILAPFMAYNILFRQELLMKRMLKELTRTD